MDPKLKILFRIVLPLFIFAALYIFITDRLLEYYQNDFDALFYIQTYKSWCFVTLGGLLIVALLPFFNKAVDKGVKEIRSAHADHSASSNQAAKVYLQSYDYAPIGILNVAPTLRIIRSNKHFTDILGYQLDALENHAFLDLIFGEDKNDFKAFVANCLAQPAAENIHKLRLLKKDGNLVFAQLNAVLFKEDEETGLLLYLLEDVTTYDSIPVAKQSQRATPKQSESELSDFVHKHLGMLDLAVGRLMTMTKKLPQILKPEEVDAAINYQDLSEHISKVMNNISTVNLIESETLIEEELYPAEVIGSAIKQLKSSGLAGGVIFKINVQNDLLLQTVPALFKVIVANIIENAVKFRKDSNLGHQVNVSFIATDNLFQFIVKDNGIGIAPEDLVHIFDMNFHGTNSTAGEGLGLFLVKKCVDKLDGQINVLSKLNHSTEITVNFKGR